MTRQNVTDGPREILTKKCPVCSGDGIVLSETSAAVDAERRLRALAASRPRSKAFRVALNARVAALVAGPAAERLAAIEAATRRRFLVEGVAEAPLDHFDVLAEGTLEKLAQPSSVSEGQELNVKLVEVGLHDPGAGVAKLDGTAVLVGQAAKLVGKKVKVRVERVLDGVAYASLLTPAAPKPADPITAESMAEKPTRASRAKKPQAAPEPVVAETEPEAIAEAEEEPAGDEAAEEEIAQAPRKRTRRGSRGGRGRKRKPVSASANGAAPDDGESEGPVIHLPPPDLGAEAAEAQPEAATGEVAAEENGAESAKPRKRTRRGSRGGRGRRKKTATASAGDAAAETSD
jgi:ribonuclease G